MTHRHPGAEPVELTRTTTGVRRVDPADRLDSLPPFPSDEARSQDPMAVPRFMFELAVSQRKDTVAVWMREEERHAEREEAEEQRASSRDATVQQFVEAVDRVTERIDKLERSLRDEIRTVRNEQGRLGGELENERHNSREFRLQIRDEIDTLRERLDKLETLLFEDRKLWSKAHAAQSPATPGTPDGAGDAGGSKPDPA